MLDNTLLRDPDHGVAVMHHILRANLPDLSIEEEAALFSFTKFRTVDRLDTSVRGSIEEISDQIAVTWDATLDPDELQLQCATSIGTALLLWIRIDLLRAP